MKYSFDSIPKSWLLDFKLEYFSEIFDLDTIVHMYCLLSKITYTSFIIIKSILFFIARLIVEVSFSGISLVVMVNHIFL